MVYYGSIVWTDDHIGAHCHLTDAPLECFERRRYPAGLR
jgi:hypothetical protein